MAENKETSEQTFLAWAPHVAVFGGLFMMWIDPRPTGVILMYAGFLVYGLLGAWTSIQQKYYKGFSLKLIKLILQMSICVMTVLPIISEVNPFIWILVLIVMDNLILTSRRIEAISAE
jgi:hypothetical protein